MAELLEQVQSAVGDAYRVERELTVGGMSRLFLATEASLSRRVVIKVLPPELASEVSAARFKYEMELTARLQHPHILPILGAGARPDLLYYVMPYVVGESLRHRLTRDGPLPVADAVRILSEVADALAYAHGEGVIHRDIKPDNILLEGRHAVLADFGVARAIIQSRTGARLTATGMLVGTPGYMSPEQVAGDHVDASADVYALAVVGYEMLAGRPPFWGPTAQAVLAASLTAPPRPLEELRADVPPVVSAAIARALAKAPTDRFHTATEFADALADAGAVATTTPSDARRDARAAAARKRRVLLWLAIATIVAGGAGWYHANRVRHERINALLSELSATAASGSMDEVFDSLQAIGVDLRDARYRTLAARVAGQLHVTTTPPRARVSLTRATPIAAFPKRTPLVIGETPVRAHPLVAGEYLVRLTSGQTDTVEFLVVVRPGSESRVARTLPPAGRSRDRMVLVDAGPSPVTGTQVPAFLIDRYEVTNAQFLRFVAAGGYRSPGFWPETLVIAERPTAWAQAVSQFVDRTGLAGPRQWVSGRYPEGKGDHPVVGVSWYEAAAYAKWANKMLPTAAQWWRAALGDSVRVFPWGDDVLTAEQRANFGPAGTRPVGALRLGVSPAGCLDMAGNVREWLADTGADGRRLVVGGSWQDPTYMFEASHAERFDPAFAGETIGFRLAAALPPEYSGSAYRR